MIKYSRQREYIRDFLAGQKDHPTAETIYRNAQKEFPNISLGTVYRNLAQLEQLGEIKKLSTGQGPDHFDGNTSPHYHVICTTCGSVIDLEMENINHINILAKTGFDGEIEGHFVYFYGTCKNCLERNGRQPSALPQTLENAIHGQ